MKTQGNVEGAGRPGEVVEMTEVLTYGMSARDCGVIRGFYSSGLAGTGRPRRGTDLAKAAYDLGREDARLREPAREGARLIEEGVARVERL